MADTMDVTIDPKLVAEARRLGLDIASEVEALLRARIEKRKRELAWQEENRAAIQMVNEKLDREGLWYERLRSP
jgi:antitoxin CcdA